MTIESASCVESLGLYGVIDGEITRAIRAGQHPLYARNVRAEACRLASATGREEMRIIDGRLQALRRTGKIVADRKADAGWCIKVS